LGKVWREPITLVEIAGRLGCMEWDVVRVARRMRLPSRKNAKNRQTYRCETPREWRSRNGCWRRRRLSARRKRSHSIVGDENSSPPQGKPLGGWRHKPSVFATHKLSRVRAPFPRRSQSQSHSKNPAGHKGIGYAPWDWWAIRENQRTDKGR